MSRFDYVKYDEIAIGQQAAMKHECQQLESMIQNLGTQHPKETGRAVASAITKLEECYMWIGKAIRDSQIARNGSAPLQEERNNE